MATNGDIEAKGPEDPELRSLSLRQTAGGLSARVRGFLETFKDDLATLINQLMFPK